MPTPRHPKQGHMDPPQDTTSVMMKRWFRAAEADRDPRSQGANPTRPRNACPLLPETWTGSLLTPATWALNDVRQSYMPVPRTETTPLGAHTPVGGPPTEQQMLVLMQPQNRHLIPASTPGAQAKLQDDDRRPRLMGYYDTQREYEEDCALSMSQGTLTWIPIRKIRPSRRDGLGTPD